MAIWSEVKNNPPVFYQFGFDTASGKATVFHALDGDAVYAFKDLIGRAISDPNWADQEGEIKVVDLPKGGPDKLAEDYYLSRLQRA